MLGAGYLTDVVKMDKVAGHTAAGTSTVNSSSVDMAADGGWDSVVFRTSFGTPATDNILKAADSADDSSWATLANPVAPGASDEEAVLDIQRPVRRYVRAEAVRGTSSTCESIWADRYRSRDRPVTNALSGTLALKQTASPAAV